MGLKLGHVLGHVADYAAAKSNQGGIETYHHDRQKGAATKAKSNQGGIETTVPSEYTLWTERAKSNQGGIETVHAVVVRYVDKLGKIEPRWD